MELAYEHMNNPTEIKIESETLVADKVQESSYYPADNEKLPLLVNLLKQQNPEKVVVFVNTRHAAESVSAALEANGINNVDRDIVLLQDGCQVGNAQGRRNATGDLIFGEDLRRVDQDNLMAHGFLPDISMLGNLL